MLEYTAATIKDMESIFARMTKAWNNGDAEGLAAMMNEMQTQSPAMHQLLLTGRNKTWADWIDVSIRGQDARRAMLRRKLKPRGSLRQLARMPKIFPPRPSPVE